MMLTVTWDPCSMIAGVMILPVPIALGLQQYRGTFRNNSNAASTSSLILFIVGGLALAMVISALSEIASEARQIPWMACIPLLATGIVCGAAAWMNRSWAWRLEKSMTIAANTNESAKYSTQDRWAAVTAMICIIGLVIYFILAEPPQYAEHVSRDNALSSVPSQAIDISFCQGARGIVAYEFTIEEQGFVDWVQAGIGSIEAIAAKVPVRPIAKPYTIIRYNALTQKLSGPDLITISNGLYYEWTKEDRGVYAAFDRTTGRAYYHAHFH
jgi:hypothetical protein